MIILIGFAFLAGIATVLSPCIIPILPALLSAGASEGKWRPLGVIIGVTTSFLFFLLAFRELVQWTGLSPNIFRYIAILIIAIFGFVMLFPRLGDLFTRLTAPIAVAGSRLQQLSVKPGFMSGIFLGAALGLVWTPCAGPILATIIALTATQQHNSNAILLAFFYTLGAAIPMFLILTCTHALANSTRNFSPTC